MPTAGRVLALTSPSPLADGESPDPLHGLSAAEVEARQAARLTNEVPASAGRGITEILLANVLTRFNAILGSLFVVILIVGPIQDGLFGVVLVVNTAIGVLQEVRSKRQLDRLALLSAPRARVVREGRISEVPPEEIVADDVLELQAGDQIVVDATVLDGGPLEVDDSMLTGESVPVVKVVGDEVLSGTAAVAGAARVRATRVGTAAYAQRLQAEAKRFSLISSELQRSTNTILRLVTWVMVPVGLLLVTSQFWRSGASFEEAVRGSVAGVGAMVPEGLVLLTSIAFAVGALRLAQRRVLVQELAAVEGLARVDVVCIDKTGTLTEPGIVLREVVRFADEPAEAILGSMAASDRAPNATMRALAQLPAGPAQPVAGVPFSSARKWSAIELEERGTWVLGAPEVVDPTLDARRQDRIAVETSVGRRVLLLATTDSSLEGEQLPSGLRPSALVVFDEQLRAEAAPTIAYLLEQGVAIRVLSGDNPATVGAVARRLGIPGAEMPLDGRDLSDDPATLATQLDTSTVVGRIQPQQKRDVVTALQQAGHVVAMTGDGVNDIAALKAADLGMAMGSGSPATRSVARIVLLDNSFGVVPRIVDEGRRVIANVERVANLFVNKTVYAAFLGVAIGLAAVPYPFFPRHLTIVSSLTIGVPGFVLALLPGAPRARSGFLGRVLRFTVPAGLLCGAATLAAYLIARGPAGATTEQARTVATFTILALGLVVLALVARPLTAVRGLLVLLMALSAVLVAAIPIARRFFALERPPTAAVVAAVGLVLVTAPAIVLAVRLVARRWPNGLGPGEEHGADQGRRGSAGEGASGPV